MRSASEPEPGGTTPTHAEPAPTTRGRPEPRGTAPGHPEPEQHPEPDPDRATPRPGRPVRGSESGRPMMAALDLLGRRWTLRVIWELQQSPAGFRELRRRADGMSSSVLADRLRQLAEAGIVTTDADGVYHLTELGDGLQPALEPLRRWAQEWAALVSGE
jgi:DNA-binding HxlR family transcriptional regulator